MIQTDTILILLKDEKTKIEYLNHKSRYSDATWIIEEYKGILSSEKYKNIIESIISGSYSFSVPTKKLISKFKVGKKRTVYTFDKYEMMVLRILTHVLYKYDYLFSSNLYSFRRNSSVRNAIEKIREKNNLTGYYGYKTDIHNYFNSINMSCLLTDLKNDIDDEKLIDLLSSIYLNDDAIFNNQKIHEEKGAMAGIPIASFMANYYLRDIDAFFYNEKITYFRYADDIIFFMKSKSDLLHYKDCLIEMIESKGLTINPKKELFIEPGDSFDFLGFSIQTDCIDISDATLRKMKGKIRRSAKSIRRWMLKKNAPLEGTLKALIKTYNFKFFGFDENELTWNRWFFPVITTSQRLHELDLYFQQWLRYVSTGNHSKKNHALVPYDVLKRCGYRSLVSEYYASLHEHCKTFEISEVHQSE